MLALMPHIESTPGCLANPESSSLGKHYFSPESCSATTSSNFRSSFHRSTLSPLWSLDHHPLGVHRVFSTGHVILPSIFSQSFSRSRFELGVGVAPHDLKILYQTHDAHEQRNEQPVCSLKSCSSVLFKQGSTHSQLTDVHF